MGKSLVIAKEEKENKRELCRQLLRYLLAKARKAGCIFIEIDFSSKLSCTFYGGESSGSRGTLSLALEQGVFSLLAELSYRPLPNSTWPELSAVLMKTKAKKALLFLCREGGQETTDTAQRMKVLVSFPEEAFVVTLENALLEQGVEIKSAQTFPDLACSIENHSRQAPLCWLYKLDFWRPPELENAVLLCRKDGICPIALSASSDPSKKKHAFDMGFEQFFSLEEDPEIFLSYLRCKQVHESLSY